MSLKTKPRHEMPRDTLLFDMNETTLNLSPLKATFRTAFGDEALASTWFSMLLHCSTVCIVTGIKSNFASLAASQLEALAARQQVKLSEPVRDEILDSFANLPPHADVKPALTRLRSAGYRTVAFSNSSSNLISTQIEQAGLSGFYDEVISVEEAGSFKPDPMVYRFAAERLNRPINELRLIAAHDWDTHGAQSAGMLAAYVDRSGAPYHPLYHRPGVYASSMDEVVAQIIAVDQEG